MRTESGADAPITGNFRPESLAHFKEVAKNMAWLLERPVQKCQEDLARIYGYSGLHELQQVLKRPGSSGPFDPRYSYLSSDAESLVEGHERRIFFILFGVPKRYWRDDHLANDRCFLVFEMGLFQEAAEHRACFSKIKEFLTYGAWGGNWPLIHGWPLGLKSWLASAYTEPFEMAKGWSQVLPQSRYTGNGRADVRWQSRATGLARLALMFQILAHRVGGRKPNGMGKVDFSQLSEELEAGLFSGPAWEPYSLVEWLTKKSAQDDDVSSHEQEALVQRFVERPSREAAAACDFVKDLKDPVAFRDRWAFESFKGALKRYPEKSRALLSTSLDEGVLQSVFLHMDEDSATIAESYSSQLWRFHCTWSEVTEPLKMGSRPTLQPVIHANGSLIVPYDENLTVMSDHDWYFCHDDSEFAREAAAVVFASVYLPAIDFRFFDYVAHHEGATSIIEIDEILMARTVNVETLRAYFIRLLGAFDDGTFPDSFGNWCQTLALDLDDEEENDRRNADGQYGDYVKSPSVLLINVHGWGQTFVEATHRNGKRVSVETKDAGKAQTPGGVALAQMVIAAASGLGVDVVVYDGVN